MLTVVGQEDCGEAAPATVSLLDELVRDGARQMLAAALQAEVAAYIERFADVRDDDGHRLVVRNGYHEERAVVTGAGAVTVTAPRVNDKRVDPETGERQRFSSKILPAWARKSPKVAEVLPLLYLHGLSSLGLRAGVGAVPRHRGRAVRGDDHPADHAVAGRGPTVRRPVARRGGLRVSVGRRDPRQRPPGAGEAVPAGDDRGPRRRPEGARRVDRRVPGIHRVVGGPAPGLQTPRDARPGAGDG